MRQVTIFKQHHRHAQVPAAPDLVHRFLLAQNTVAAQTNRNNSEILQFRSHVTSYERSWWCLKISVLLSGNRNICEDQKRTTSMFRALLDILGQEFDKRCTKHTLNLLCTGETTRITTPASACASEIVIPKKWAPCFSTWKPATRHYSDWEQVKKQNLTSNICKCQAQPRRSIDLTLDSNSFTKESTLDPSSFTKESKTTRTIRTTAQITVIIEQTKYVKDRNRSPVHWTRDGSH